MLMVCPLMTLVVGVAPGPILNVVPSMTAMVEPSRNVRPPAVIVENGPPNGGMVVVANPMPSGPMLIVCPLTTLVVCVAPGPIVNVVPSITATEEPSKNVIPPAVIVENGPPKGGMVVVANPMPSGPILMVSPLRILVVCDAPGPIVNVVPSMTAMEEPSKNVRPPAVIVENGPPNGGMVVVANPMPLGPILTVWPSMTLVVGVAPGPILNVVPPTTAMEDPTEKAIPLTVTAAGTALLPVN
jgi:hypothetical protein